MSAIHSTAGAETREKLVTAATRVFAEHTIESASLLDIARQAGQRNRGAVHYHFGSRNGLLLAVMEQYVEQLATRQSAMIKAAEVLDGDDLKPVLETIVRPITELADLGWRGRCYVVVLAELVEQDPNSLDPEVSTMLYRTGGAAGFALMRERMPELPDDVAIERVSLAATFVLRAVADRARTIERGDAGRRPQLEQERFITNLVEMATAMLEAPHQPTP